MLAPGEWRDYLIERFYFEEQDSDSLALFIDKLLTEEEEQLVQGILNNNN